MSTPEHAGTVIAVDGPSGSGKSSTARGVARALGFAYLDTGAMYRAATWWMIAHDVDVADPAAVAAHAGEPVLEIGTDPGAPAVRIDGTDVSRPIRNREVTNSVSAVSSVPEIRAWLIARQREIAGDACERGAGIVVEGRDIGTVVSPEAPVKVYLTASPEERARRRSGDVSAERAPVDVNEAEMARRDRLDAAQSAKAADAVLIDATEMNLDEVIDEVLRLVKERVPA